MMTCRDKKIIRQLFCGAIMAVGLSLSCVTRVNTDDKFHLTVLDPEHFHAALVQKSPVTVINDAVEVYAPDSAGYKSYKTLIDTYNSRENNPTNWQIKAVIGDDFLEQFKNDNVGNIVVLAGNNRNKPDYIEVSIESGKNVLADKPLAIDKQGYDKLVRAYENASRRGLLIYELMTERYDTLNISVRNLLADKDLFGELLPGTPDSPAVYMKSTHHFYKTVSGAPLIRPLKYYDVSYQGEGIADVTTHLIDLIFWQCFPDKAVKKDNVNLISATHYPTVITPEQFKLSTQWNDSVSAFPDFLDDYVSDGNLEVNANGNITFAVGDVNMAIDVQWDFEASEAGGDTFSAVYKGSKATIEVVQDSNTGFVKNIYVTPVGGERYLIDIPKEQRLGHEDHFNRVVAAFLRYLQGNPVQNWEKVNTLTKYYLITEAVAMASAEN